VSDKETTIKQMIAEKLGVREDQVTPQASFMDDLGADSLDLLELIVAFKCAFDIEIPADDAQKLRTVQDALDYLRDKV
jgi:acyl carrier protein